MAFYQLLYANNGPYPKIRNCYGNNFPAILNGATILSIVWQIQPL